MKITAIIYNHNNGIGLEQCVHSILNQNHTESEVLIVDDASTGDSSRAIIDRLLKMNPAVIKAVLLSEKIGFLKSCQDALNSLNHDGAYILLKSTEKIFNFDYFSEASRILSGNRKCVQVYGITQCFNAKNEFIGTVGKVNGLGEKNGFFLKGTPKDVTIAGADEMCDGVTKGKTEIPTTGIVQMLNSNGRDLTAFLHKVVRRTLAETASSILTIDVPRKESPYSVNDEEDEVVFNAPKSKVKKLKEVKDEVVL